VVEPCLDHAGTSNKSGRLGRHLVRTQAASRKESNWVPTRADGNFEVAFRFYGPEQPLFDKTWVLPDIERVE
jgi:hypothetical protein